MKPSIKYLIILLLCILGIITGFYIVIHNKNNQLNLSDTFTKPITFPPVPPTIPELLDKNKKETFILFPYTLGKSFLINFTNNEISETTEEKLMENKSNMPYIIKQYLDIYWGNNSFFIEHKDQFKGLDFEKDKGDDDSFGYEIWAISTDYRKVFIEAESFEPHPSESDPYQRELKKREYYICDLIEFKCNKTEFSPDFLLRSLGFDEPGVSFSVETGGYTDIYFDQFRQKIFGLLPVTKQYKDETYYYSESYFFSLNLTNKNKILLTSYDLLKNNLLKGSDYLERIFYNPYNDKIGIIYQKTNDYSGKIYTFLGIFNSDFSLEDIIDLSKYFTSFSPILSIGAYDWNLKWSSDGKLIALQGREWIRKNKFGGDDFLKKILLIDLDKKSIQEVYKIEEKTAQFENYSVNIDFSDLSLHDIVNDNQLICFYTEEKYYSRTGKGMEQIGSELGKINFYTYDIPKGLLSKIGEYKIIREP